MDASACTEMYSGSCTHSVEENKAALFDPRLVHGRRPQSCSIEIGTLSPLGAAPAGAMQCLIC